MSLFLFEGVTIYLDGIFVLYSTGDLIFRLVLHNSTLSCCAVIVIIFSEILTH